MHAGAALLTGTGVHPQGRRAHPPVLQRGRRLDREPFLPQRGLEARAQLGEPFREHKVLWGALALDRPAPTGRHPRQVGPHPATHLFVGTGQRMLQPFQRPYHPGRDGWTATPGGVGTRRANEQSPAATRAAHGNVAAPWRLAGVSGTQSATCRRGPRPVTPCCRDRKSLHGRLSSWGAEKSLSLRRSEPQDNPLSRGIH